MKLVASMEQWLADIMKGLPQLSKENKDLLVKAWPWIALIFGVLQLLSAMGLWDFLQQAQRWGLFADFAGYHISTFDLTLAYISIALLVATAVLLLLAYAPLKVHARRGWELLFVVSLINLVSGVLSLFISGRGFGSFLFSLFVSVVVFYLLIQVRSYYKDTGVKSSEGEKKHKKESKK